MLTICLTNVKQTERTFLGGLVLTFNISASCDFQCCVCAFLKTCNNSNFGAVWRDKWMPDMIEKMLAAKTHNSLPYMLRSNQVLYVIFPVSWNMLSVYVMCVCLMSVAIICLVGRITWNTLSFCWTAILSGMHDLFIKWLLYSCC
jgi:hypothetical protein